MFLKKFIIIFFLLFVSGCSSVDKESLEETKKVIPNEINILFAGDVMLDWGIRDIMIKKGVTYPLKGLKNFMDSFDYRFCNLECPISDIGEVHPDKKYVFRANPKFIDLLKFAGINGVSLANNHACDYGKEGLLSTISNLVKNGISVTGAGTDAGTAHNPVEVILNNITIAILSYTSIAYTNSFATSDSPGVARAKIELIGDDIKQYRNYYDYIVVSIHWGDEYSDYPNQKQIDLAHSIIESGADVIIGHHPHIFQGIEIFRDKPIFYSLGNFIFGSINEDIKNNILVQITFSKDGIKSFYVYPINGNDVKKPFQYNLLKNKEAAISLNRLINISKPLKSEFNTKSVIKKDMLLYYF